MRFSIVCSTLKRTALPIIVILALGCCYAFASGAPQDQTKDNLPQVLLGLILILLAAKLGADLVMRFGQPAVLGELIFGILIGNLCLIGFHGCDFVRSDASIKMLSEIGVIILLFQVGLESDLAEMVQVGGSSLLVATLGVIAPFFLGWAVSAVFMPDQSVYVHVFIGATLCATSVGITARVMRDLGRLHTPEARIVLGAAVIDDVQGLVILAAVTGIIKSVAQGGAISSTGILLVVAKATIFLAAAIVIGRWLSPKVFRIASRLKAADLLLATALAICFGLAYLAKQVGLAPIVGAFAAGLILDELHWQELSEREKHSIEELVAPIAALFVPVFFVRMGSVVDLTTLANPSVLAFAGALTLAAIVGKQVCGLGVMQKGLDRLSVGIGMIPRGEVGLIFAALGADLVISGQRVVQPTTFSAIVIMVLVTTIMTPTALKWSLKRFENGLHQRESDSEPTEAEQA